MQGWPAKPSRSRATTDAPIEVLATVGELQLGADLWLTVSCSPVSPTLTLVVVTPTQTAYFGDRALRGVRPSPGHFAVVAVTAAVPGGAATSTTV